MPTVTAEQATIHTRTDQHDLLATPPPRTIPLRIPRRPSMTLVRILQTLKRAWTIYPRRAVSRLHPDYPRQETVYDRAARIDLYLYIRSLSG
jgi:hypothetical protein